jgi:NAD(P)-dependent dehydrogenase (short-subunit alcohol dehydrogenase family)
MTFAANSKSINSLGTRIMRYGFSKLLNVLFAKELQRRCDVDGISIISISFNPGLMATDGALGLYPIWVRGPLKAIGRSPLQGAKAALFVATSDEIALQKDKYRGAYLNQNGVIENPSALANDPHLAAELWEISHQLIHDALADDIPFKF